MGNLQDATQFPCGIPRPPYISHVLDFFMGDNASESLEITITSSVGLRKK